MAGRVMLREFATPAPAISILALVRDAAHPVDAALDSVLAQDMRDWELILIDIGEAAAASAAFAAALARRRDPRLRLLRLEGAGAAVARSRAMAESRGEGMLLLDTRDWLAPGALARLAEALAAAPEAVGAHGGCAVMAETARPGDRPLRGRQPALPHGDLLEQLLVGNPFADGGQLLLRREAVRQAGPFLPHLRLGEDWEYWIRLSLLGPWAAVPGGGPVLHLRRRAGRAGHRMPRDPASIAPAMLAIWGNPALEARLGRARFLTLQRRAEAEAAWTIGQELIRDGQRAAGLERLRASVAQAPTPRRALLLAAAHALPMLPRALHGPFVAYPG
ncbi:glycosyltransferase family A protein [Roseicella sp. DB1501]|uniref:glycosyltransferase family 2 protein n=1 Tax=Roseicella sp. DB1501 TaxID=2730925 RepID=UPI001491985A|nr:glycosyltransferase family 2 protein [Roseicella sp. DB1501]